jgi:enoyl-CoA hydratase/carnithine racemase
MTMILPCDVIVASEAAKFGMFFIKVGLVPELASTHFLVQRMGFGRASEMCLSGRLYPAAEAAQCGLVDHVTPTEDLLPRAFAIAEGIAANPDLQLGMIKRLLTANGSATDLRAIQQRESQELRECWTSAEHREAVAAFLEKRPARFR